MVERDTDRYRSLTRRALMLGGIQAGLLSTLVGRMYYLQVLQSDRYTMLAEENRINMRLLSPVARADPRPVRRAAGGQPAELPRRDGVGAGRARSTAC